jgi:hypothetical protein
MCGRSRRSRHRGNDQTSRNGYTPKMTVDAILNELLGGKTAYPSAPDEWGRACDPGSSSAVRGVVRSARSHDRDQTLTLYANVGPRRRRPCGPNRQRLAARAEQPRHWGSDFASSGDRVIGGQSLPLWRCCRLIGSGRVQKRPTISSEAGVHVSFCFFLLSLCGFWGDG